MPTSDRLPNPFAGIGKPFELDEDAFLAAIEPMPSFIESPRPEYLSAAEIMPMLEVLASASSWRTER